MKTLSAKYLKYLAKQFPFFMPKVVASCKDWIDEQNRIGDRYRSARSSWYELVEKGGNQVHPLPQTVQAPQKKAFDVNMSYRTSDSYLFMLRNCFLFRHKGIVLSNYHYCFREFTHHFNIFSIKKFFRKNPFYTFSNDYKEVSGTGAVLISPESHNYYHWLSDVLPRIKLYEKVMDQVDHFCVASSVPEKFLEILSVFGIPKTKLLLVKDDEKLHFDNLLVASLPGSEGRAPKWAIDFVREKLLPKKKSGATRKIYLKRGNVTQRRILNEDSLVKLLSARGFEIIDPDQLSIPRQAALMQEAKTVISAHGAALSNLVFAPENCTVIEIFSPDYFRTDCFYTLSDILNLNYWYIVGTKPSDAPWGDIIVPEEIMEQTLNNISLKLE
jgi:Glycosyltransferase 61